MKFKIQSIHFDADKNLVAFIEERMEKIGRLFDNIIDGEVFLRIEKSNHLDNKVAEIKIQIPGKILFSKEQSKSFEESVDLAIEAMRKQISKHKDKLKGI